MDQSYSERLPMKLFSVRAGNVLRRLNIRSVGAFSRVDWQTIECYQLGQNTRNEMQRIQAEFNPKYVSPRELTLNFGDTWSEERSADTGLRSDLFCSRLEQPSVCEVSNGLEMSGEWQDSSVQLLELSVRAHHVLEQSHIKVLKDFLSADFETMQMRQLGATTRAELCALQSKWRQKLRHSFTPPQKTTSQSHTPHFPADEQLMWVAQRDTTQEDTETKEDSRSPSRNHVLDLPRVWPLVVRELCATNERGFAILARRFGLDGCALYTLEELATAFGVSRERVRQVEASVMARLRSFLFSKKVRGYSKFPHAAFADEIANFQNTVYGLRFPVSDAEINRIWTEHYGTIAEPHNAYLELLCDFLEVTRVCLQRQEVGRSVQTFWLREPKDRERIVHAIREARHALEAAYLPLDSIDIAIAINRKLPKPSPEGVHPFFIERVLELCPDVQQVGQKYELSFEHLPSHVRHIERVMRDWAVENHFVASSAQIAQEVSRRLSAGESVGEHVISSACAASTLLIAIGRNGGWSLREHAGETRLLHELIEEALRVLNRPASAQELLDWVALRRSTTLASIAGTMSQHDKFQHIGINQYVLREWGLNNDDDEPVRRTGTKYQTQFEDYLLQLFLDNDVQPIALAKLAKCIGEHFGWPDVSVRDRIGKSPCLDFEKLPNNRVSVHWRDTPKPTNEKVSHISNSDSLEPKRGTKRGHIQDVARRILQSSPQRSLDGPVLVKKVVRETGYASAMIYNTLSSMPDVERGGAFRQATYRLRSFRNDL